MTGTPRPAPASSYAPPASYASYAVRPAEQPGKRVPDRKVTEIRRLLDGPHPPAPADLAERAMVRGRRLLRRRRARHALVWLLLVGAVVAAAVVAAVYLRTPRPLDVTPPMRGL